MSLSWLKAECGRAVVRLGSYRAAMACAICAASLSALPVLASSVMGEGALVLQADSPDAHLSVHGQVSVSGAAPLPVWSLPAGEYTLAAEGPGLPAVRGRFVLSPEGISRRPWAGPATALLPPGYSHLERGDSRGWALAAAAAGGAAMTASAQNTFRKAQDRMDRAQRVYSLAVSEESIADARHSLLAASQERGDRREVRNLWIGFLGATWLGAAMEAVVLTPQPSFTTQDGGTVCYAELPRAGGVQAALRSVLIPGGGQRYMGRTSRASFFFTATAALTAASIVAHDSFLEARRDQALAQRRFDDLDDELQFEQTRRSLEKAAERTDNRNTLRWVMVGAAAGVYAWNAIDAFSLGQSAGIPGFAWSVTPSSDGVLMSATWSMP